MSIPEKLNHINKLQAKILAAGEYDSEIKKRINYRFRLDWNYHSNSMEGNTLTKEETRSVMIGNLTVGGKPYKDVAEMRGHDDVVQEILKVGKGEVRLSEKRVKEIHRSIMFEEDSEKRFGIGEWKSKDNYVLNYKGERFDFKSHTEVADEMHSLLNFLNAKIDRLETGKEDLHPLLTAAKFHLWFVSIHPFYDGNGRTARLLTNLFLISQGFPPIIIKTDEKEKYNRYLADVQAYGGSPDLFDEFLADLLIRSQQLVLDAIDGKSIEEAEDIDKEIDLFKKGFEERPVTKPVVKSAVLIAVIYLDYLTQMFELFESKHRAISDLFSTSKYSVAINGFEIADLQALKKVMLNVQSYKPVDIQKRQNELGVWEVEINTISINVRHVSFTRGGQNHFDVESCLAIHFDKFDFKINNDFYEEVRLYVDTPLHTEINLMVSEMMRGVMEEIKKKSATV
ncbi:MAG: Fic family protein [Flavobacteriales bacterium]|jgi:Fic family protein|nr:Fic family protein [Flavobacteriales bacterium]